MIQVTPSSRTATKTIRYITASDAARRLGVSRQRVSQWIESGRLAAFKVGRSRLVNRDELRRPVRLTVGRRQRPAPRRYAERYATAREFAGIVGCNLRSLYGLIARGRIEHIRVRGQILIPRTQVQQWARVN